MVDSFPEVNSSSDWLPRVVSCFLSLLLLVIGILFVIIPSAILEYLFQEESPNLHLARILGAVLLSSSLHTFLLAASSSSSCVRAALTSHALMGLLGVLVGLWNDRTDDNDGGGEDPMAGHMREYETVLGIGAVVFVAACAGLMASFWPAVLDEAEPRQEQQEEGRQRRQRDSASTAVEDEESRPQRREIDRDGDGLANAENTQPLLPKGEQQHDNDNSEDTHDNTKDEENIQQEGTIQSESPGSSPQPVPPTAQEQDEQQSPQSRIQGTRRLIKLAAPQVSYLYMGCIVLLIRLPFSLSIPHFVSTTLGALGRSDYAAARSEILLLFILGTIDAALDFWCVFLFGYAKERIVRTVRTDTFRAILRQDMDFFDHHTSGDLASRLSSDCGEMAGDLTWFFRFSIESVVRITGITAYMLIRCPILGACALSIVPVVAIINKIYGTWLQKNAVRVQNALARANSVAQEALACVRTVIAFAAEGAEQEKYDREIGRQYRLNIQQLFITGAYFMLVSTFLINTCVQAALLLIGTELVRQGKLTAEILLAFMLYQGQLQNETMNLFNSYSSLIKSSGAGDKVFQLLDRVPPPPGTGSPQVKGSDNFDSNDSDGATAATTITTTDPSVIRRGSSAVQFKGVSFCYPTRPSHKVLDGFYLDIPAGSTVALVGPSGCGKSTVVGLLERFYDPSSGEICVDGVDLKGIDLKAHRRRVGIVTQDPVLFSGTIMENISYGCPANADQAIDAARLANAHGFITSFPNGYDTQVGERGVQLSGGQKQRLAIARAIIKNPTLLLLDEATSALDAYSEHVVQEALDRLLNVNKNMTTVVVAHRLRTVRNADCIAFIEDGRVVERGTHKELMQLSNGRYQQMVKRAGTAGTLPTGT